MTDPGISSDSESTEAGELIDRGKLRKALIVVGFAALATIVLSIVSDWWERRPMERRVEYWRADATQCARNRAYGEAERTWVWLMKAFPRSRQMADVHLEFARFCLDDLGEVERARVFVERQLDLYPFHWATLDAWKLQKRIELLSDRASGYPVGAAWKALVMARRQVEAGPPEAGIAALEAAIEQFPRSALIPDMLFALGNAALEGAGRKSLARKAFGRLRQEYRGHPLEAQIPPADRLLGEDATPDDLSRVRSQYETS